MMLSPLFSATPAVYLYVAAAMPIAFALVKLGHRVLDLLRDLRDFRDGY